MITAKQLRRPMRFLVFAGLAITLGLYIRSRPEKLTMQGDDRSMIPAYYPGTSLRARAIDEDFDLGLGRDVLYVMARQGEDVGFVGRVQGLPGDVIAIKDGIMHRNGDRIGPARMPNTRGHGLGTVPEGQLLILNVNPDPHYSDSRQFGFVPRDQIQAIILGEIK